MDILGEALLDFYHKTAPDKLWIYSHYGPREEMPVAVYFRDVAIMPKLETLALQACRGKVLDIGAGAGSHALALQERGLDVTAVEISPKAVQVMRERGITKAVEADIFLFNESKYDTLLLLMNGIGLVGDLHGLERFLQHAKTLLAAGGQLLFDSSDVSYLYDGSVPLTGDYFGEIMCRYGYKKQKTPWFTWLYVDQGTLIHIAANNGWQTELLFEDGHDQYLVRLTLTF